MITQELEFQISQYLDGTLAGAELAALEERLATDSSTRQLLAEYRQLDLSLRSAPLPPIDFDALSDRITASVARQPEPAQSYRLPWSRAFVGFAVAASVLLAVGVGIRRLQSPAGSGAEVAVNTTPNHRDPIRIEVVDAVAAAAPSTQPAVEVAVGPSPLLQQQPALAFNDDELLTRPSQVFIARSGNAAREPGFLP